MHLNNKSFWIVSIMFVLVTMCSLAQLANEQPKTYTIADITVAGNEFADEQTVISLTGLRIGEQITLPGDKLQLAVKNLWKRKQFSDVAIVVDKITPVGIFLEIKVKEFPRLSQKIVENNEEVSLKDILEAIAKSRGDILTPYDNFLIAKRIKDVYKEEGLMFAKIDVRQTQTDTASYVNLSIYIEEGVDFWVRSINFTGNSKLSSDDLAGSFDETSTKSWWQIWKSDKFKIEDYEKDKVFLIDYFQENGFIDAKIIRDTIIYDENSGAVDINLDVQEGNRYYVRNIEFQGNTVYPDETLLRRLQFEIGEVYNKVRFEQNLKANEDQSDVTSIYADNGFLNVLVKSDEKRVADDSLDIKVNIYENKRIKIRRVDITGNTKTKDKVIRRELFTRPGEYFNRSAIIRSIRQLGAMNYFNPEALQKGLQIKPFDDENIDIEYKVEERSTDMINASIGFAGTFGLTGSVGFTLNNFSISEPLSGGAGQIFNFNAEIGQASRYNTFAIGFTEPWLFDEPITVGTNLYYRNINFFFQQTTRGASINIGKRFRWPDDYFRGDIRLTAQENFVDSASTNAAFYRAGTTTEYSIAATISRTSFNSPFFPTVGSRFSFSNQFAMGALGIGSTDFLKSQLQFEMAQPLFRIDDQDRLVLFLSSSMGFTSGFASDTTIPPVELFYMGGNGLSGFAVTPLRGYENQSIGPRYGGRIMSRHMAELRFAVSLDPMPIYFYGFAEAGNVWETFKQTDPFDLNRSAGIGIQLMIPQLGLIGFSYGYGFDGGRNATGPNGWEFLFHLGQQ